MINAPAHWIKLLVIAMIISLAFCSCQQHQANNNIPQVGDFDSAAIANDTVMQQAIESSYEYAKTLTINDKLVYDVVAYGGPASRGEYAILRRGADNKADTVVREERHGIIADAFTGDLNKDSRPEIYIVLQSADNMKAEIIAGYQFDKNGKVERITTPDYSKAEINEHYTGHDSIYLENQMIVRLFPEINSENKPAAWLKAHYALINNKLLLNSKEGLKYN
jgi:hypothetical protein